MTAGNLDKGFDMKRIIIEILEYTLQQIIEMWWHRISKTSPGNPKWYVRTNSAYLSTDRKELGSSYLKHKPDAKPVLPKGVTRLEDIEGYEP